jgi:hypothetical protein
MARYGKVHKGGRPSKAEELKLVETIIRSGQEALGTNTPLEDLWQTIWREASQGSKEHVKFVLEYAYGKPKQRVEAEVTGSIAPKLIFEKAE